MAAKKPGVDLANSKLAPVVAGGRSVRLRATALGQYGRPISVLIQSGAVFSMAVADLEKKEDALERAGKTKDDNAREARVGAIEAKKTMSVDGVVYVLPSWTVDAKTPIETDEEEEPVLGPATGSDVI